ncbi:HTH-type transcriptional regulator GltC [Corynebacterium provencense]|uniref:HTH-type transcriptional regulator GltC n=1 Tax=Corynebacterium provencense TaxID=1737425 RepID=A0A2Z3YWB2_9CORY|nr:LysR family transcriptional regulator [Corynebacterium provencense]AWT27240.1 HTH-type transcriptional regulator GltC [Corynebacterium provencense]
MRIDDLGWFLDLVDTCNMADTAAATGLSQSSLSRRLAGLEAEVGTTLFDRRGRNLVLNHRGELLADTARKTRATWADGVEAVRRLVDPARGTVRLCFMHSLGTWMVPDLLRTWRAAHPTVEFELVQGAARQLVDRVVDGRSDLAFVGPEPVAQIRAGQVHWCELAQQRLGLAVPEGHRLATGPDGSPRTSVDLREAREELFVAMLEGFGTRMILDQLSEDAGFRPRLVFESMELTTVAGLVTAGLGVAMLPLDDPNLRLPGMQVIPLRTRRRRELGVVWSASGTQAPPVAAFRDFVVSDGRSAVTPRHATRSAEPPA